MLDYFYIIRHSGISGTGFQSHCVSLACSSMYIVNTYYLLLQQTLTSAIPYLTSLNKGIWVV
jgi:hypothetical protein